MLYKWNISAFRYCVNTEVTFDACNLTAVNSTRADVMPWLGKTGNQIKLKKQDKRLTRF